MDLRVCRLMHKRLLSNVQKVDFFLPITHKLGGDCEAVLDTLHSYVTVTGQHEVSLQWHSSGKHSVEVLNQVLWELYDVPCIHDDGEDITFHRPCVRCGSSFFCTGVLTMRDLNEISLRNPDTPHTGDGHYCYAGDKLFRRAGLLKGPTCLVDLQVSNADGLSQTALWHGNTWRELVSVISISHRLVTLKVRNNDLGATGARFLGSALLTTPLSTQAFGHWWQFHW